MEDTLEMQHGEACGSLTVILVRDDGSRGQGHRKTWTNLRDLLEDKTWRTGDGLVKERWRRRRCQTAVWFLTSKLKAQTSNRNVGKKASLWEVVLSWSWVRKSFSSFVKNQFLSSWFNLKLFSIALFPAFQLTLYEIYILYICKRYIYTEKKVENNVNDGLFR